MTTPFFSIIDVFSKFSREVILGVVSIQAIPEQLCKNRFPSGFFSRFGRKH
jgi:hypothetical protein